MAIPATDLIQKTFPKAYIHTFSGGDRFVNALDRIEAGIQAGKIYNQEFQAAKSWIANGCEHAQHVDSGPARGDNRGSYGDCRDDIGYAFSMNQAAKMLRELQKLQKKNPSVITPGIIAYMATLEQIDNVWKWLQSVKPIIVKGRKPVEHTEEELRNMTINTGICAICEQRQKLNKRTMVHHGFQISDGMGHYFGHRSGKCFGTGRPPYELSNEANKEYKTYLEGERRKLLVHIGKLQDSAFDTLMGQEYQKGKLHPVIVEYKKGTPEYERQRQRNLSQAEQELRWLDDAIPYQQTKIDGWKLQPLKYGE